MSAAEEWYVFCGLCFRLIIQMNYHVFPTLYHTRSHTNYFFEMCCVYFIQFDPLGLSDYVPTDWARRAELSNGRSAMLATVGWFFPKVFGTFDSTDVTTTDPIDAILQADPQWWAQWILICGVFETWKYKQEMQGKSFLGGAEPAVDYLKLWPADAAKQEELKTKELKNARLAMIGIAGLVSNHVLPGSCPVPPGF
jgi:hypothetical protein